MAQPTLSAGLVGFLNPTTVGFLNPTPQYAGSNSNWELEEQKNICKPYIFLLIYRNDFSQKISLQRLKKINISKKSKISFSGLNVLAPPLFQIWYTQQ